MHTARLTPLPRRMTISLTVELITQVPLLKNIPAKCPQRTIPRKNIVYRTAQYLTRINIKTVNQLQANRSIANIPVGVDSTGFKCQDFRLRQDGTADTPALLSSCRRTILPILLILFTSPQKASIDIPIARTIE